MTKEEIRKAKDMIYKMWRIEKAHTSTANLMIARYTKELEAKLNMQQHPSFSVGECMTESDFHDQRLHTAIMEDEPWSIAYDLIDRDMIRHTAAYHS